MSRYDDLSRAMNLGGQPEYSARLNILGDRYELYDALSQSTGDHVLRADLESARMLGDSRVNVRRADGVVIGMIALSSFRVV